MGRWKEEVTGILFILYKGSSCLLRLCLSHAVFCPLFLLICEELVIYCYCVVVFGCVCVWGGGGGGIII